MPATVADQMPDDERRKRLIHGLSATGAEKVAVEVSHLMQAVGVEKAEQLVETMAESHEYTGSEFSKKISRRRSGMCSVNRLAALNACLEADKKSTTNSIDTHNDDE